MFLGKCFRYSLLTMDDSDNKEPQVATQPNTGNDEASVVMNMESMIKTLIASQEKFKEELGKHQDLLNAIFENDSTYQEHSEAAKAAAKIKSATKQQVLKQPQAADLANKVKTLRSELKENKASLSDYLREFQRMSGISEIEGHDGEIREIVFTAKLVNKSSRL